MANTLAASVEPSTAPTSESFPAMYSQAPALQKRAVTAAVTATPMVDRRTDFTATPFASSHFRVKAAVEHDKQQQGDRTYILCKLIVVKWYFKDAITAKEHTDKHKQN